MTRGASSLRPTLAAALAVVAGSWLLACAPKPLEPVAVQIGVAPPMPTIAPAPPDAAATASLSPFAEGWGLDIGLTRGAEVLFDEYGDGVGVVEGDEVRVQKRPFDGLIEDVEARVRMVFGPSSSPWALAIRGGLDLPRLFRARGGAWVDGRALLFEGFRDVRVSAWDDARALAFLEPSERQGGFGVDVQAAPPGAALSIHDPPRLELDPMLRLVDVVANARGDVVALAVSDEQKTKHVIELWRGGKPPGVVIPLPEVTTTIEQIDAEACIAPDGAVYVVRDVTTRSAHDGKMNLESAAHLLTLGGGQSFTRTEMPRSTAYFQLRGCAVAGDGGVWVAFDANQKVHPGEARVDRYVGGLWQRVAVPPMAPVTKRSRFAFVNGRHVVETDTLTDKPPPVEALSPVRIRADDSGAIWLRTVRVLNGDRMRASGLNGVTPERFVVLRSGPPRALGVLDWDAAVGGPLENAIARSDRSATEAIGPAAPDCKRLWVSVDKAPVASALGYAYPQLGAVVHAHPELARLAFSEMKISGRRVVIVPVADWGAAQALAKKIRRAYPEAAPPEVLCGEPAHARPIKF